MSLNIATKARSKFEEFIMNQVGVKTSQTVHEQMNLPAKTITVTYKKPTTAHHRVVIAFAELLQIHPYELIRDWKLGIDRLHQIEIDYHRREYENEMQATAAA